jgi:type IV secretory pathway VirB10-like protein
VHAVGPRVPGQPAYPTAPDLVRYAGVQRAAATPSARSSDWRPAGCDCRAGYSGRVALWQRQRASEEAKRATENEQRAAAEAKRATENAQRATTQEKLATENANRAKAQEKLAIENGQRAMTEARRATESASNARHRLAQLYEDVTRGDLTV